MDNNTMMPCVGMEILTAAPNGGISRALLCPRASVVLSTGLLRPRH